jgi:ABC-type transport system involved in Fe-S cluster assembly fused permease/ATPase subunit
LKSYETVKYFSAEKYESERYCMRVQEVRNANCRNTRFGALMNICQDTFMMAGFMAVSSILVGRIFSGAHSAGKFVYLSTYMYQLESTLKSLTALSRPLQARPNPLGKYDEAFGKKSDRGGQLRRASAGRMTR